jgi:flagellar motor protein MotB
MARSFKLKKFKEEHTDTEGSWAISYGDMITLLLSFFVIFFSFDFNQEKEEQLFDKAIHNISLIESDALKGKGLTESATIETQETDEISTFVKKTQKGQVVVFFKGANFFDTGKDDVNEFGQVLLNKFVEKYLPYAGKFRLKIQAFTDDRPVSNKYARYRDNVELSALRAISVMRNLNRSGLPMHRVEIGGQGVLNQETINYFGINTTDIDEIRKMSRTVAFILYREDAS